MIKRKIAIIGGGLFGCHVASKLSEMKNISYIDLYEKNETLFKEASSNNQHRLHSGFHYPRSLETIKQIKEVSENFKSNFSDCVFDIKNNYYFVSKEGKTTYSEYKNTFADQSQEVELGKFSEYLNINKLDGVLLSNEKGINIYKLKEKIYLSLNKQNIALFLNKPWEERYKKNYDFIINCSYTNPQLTTDKLKVKYELCDLVLIRNPYKLEEYSFTVMDGPFSSLYMTENKDIYTLSNVEKTPFFKTEDINELNKALNNIQDFNLQEIDKAIIEKSLEYYKFNSIDIVGRYICPKSKILHDFNDVRKTEIIFENKNVTVLQGKISTLDYCAEQIVEYLK
jgi:D-amino-acid oxidase